jgi:SAM-dependent methyltransferase
MDRDTLAAYDHGAVAFADDWHAQPAPVDLHDIVMRFFIKGGLTADIGCGSGREVAWLNANGFPAQGFDASANLLTQARARYPSLTFTHTELPALEVIAAATYDNILCETVIMHLDRALIAPSVRRMIEITRPGGIFYLSWRVTDGADVRDAHGRLYAAFEASLVRSEFATATLLLDEEVISASSGKTIHRLVARKPNKKRAPPGGGDRAGPSCPTLLRLRRTIGGDGDVNRRRSIRPLAYSTTWTIRRERGSTSTVWPFTTV